MDENVKHLPISQRAEMFVAAVKLASGGLPRLQEYSAERLAREIANRQLGDQGEFGEQDLEKFRGQFEVAIDDPAVADVVQKMAELETKYF